VVQWIVTHAGGNSSPRVGFPTGAL
jgi:hypothetical protein